MNRTRKVGLFSRPASQDARDDRTTGGGGGASKYLDRNIFNLGTKTDKRTGTETVSIYIPCIQQGKLKNTPTCAVAPQFSCCTVEKGKKHFLNIIPLKLLVA